MAQSCENSATSMRQDRIGVPSFVVQWCRTIDYGFVCVGFCTFSLIPALNLQLFIRDPREHDHLACLSSLAGGRRLHGWSERHVFNSLQRTSSSGKCEHSKGSEAYSNLRVKRTTTIYPTRAAAIAVSRSRG